MVATKLMLHLLALNPRDNFQYIRSRLYNTTEDSTAISIPLEGSRSTKTADVHIYQQWPAIFPKASLPPTPLGHM